MMAQPKNPAQFHLVVLARYPKGHYRRSVKANWHVYGDLAFLNNEDGKKSAGDLVLDLRGKGVKAKIEYRHVVDSRADEVDFDPPKACLQVVTKGMEVQTHDQNPVDAALVALYETLPQECIDKMGTGSQGGFALPFSLKGPSPIYSAVFDDLSIDRFLIKDWAGRIHRNGDPTWTTPETGTFYHVSCEKFGCPTIAITKVRRQHDSPKRVYGNFVTEYSTWASGYLDEQGINVGLHTLDSGWSNLSDEKTAKEAKRQAVYTLACFVQQKLIAIRDSS